MFETLRKSRMIQKTDPDFHRVYAKRNNARRIWASTPQNCATTNEATFENGHPLKVYLFVVMRFIASLRKFYYRNCPNYSKIRFPTHISFIKFFMQLRFEISVNHANRQSQLFYQYAYIGHSDQNAGYNHVIRVPRE